MPLLEGTDGTEKMSKSLGNYIGISEEPRNMFGKLMSIPDKLIIKYMELLTNIPAETIAGHKKGMEEGGNPKDFKTLLAKTIVSCYYDAKTADQEEKDFQLSFAQKDIQYDKHSYDVSDKYPAGSSVTALELTATAADFEKMNLSATEIKRRIADGAILINEKKITNFSEKIQIEDDIKMKLGKKNFCLLKVKK
jgi:tyrosyl-tRNA synthetase